MPIKTFSSCVHMITSDDVSFTAICTDREAAIIDEAINRAPEAEESPTKSPNTGMAAEAAQIAAQIENEIIGAHSNRFVTVDRVLLEKCARQLRHA
jgi:hypothetical protein